MSTPASSSTLAPRRNALGHSTPAATRRSATSWLAILFFAGALLFGATALALGDVFYLRLATEALIFGGLALSVDLLLGRVGLLPLGQALFFGPVDIVVKRFAQTVRPVRVRGQFRLDA